MMSKTVRFPNERIPKKDRMLEKKHILSRSVDGTIKRLNELFKGEKTERVIFSTDARILRHKLKEHLISLMFMEPEEYGQRAEELIWSKVFYSVIVKVRHYTKSGERLPDPQEKLYRNHLLQGIGFYQDLSLRLQQQYSLVLNRGIDFARPPPSHGDVQRMKFYGTSLYLGCNLLDSSADNDEDDTNERAKRLRTWANEALHRCLVYMGDLTRYQHDYFHDDLGRLCIATRYYHQALLILPETGLPFNQLAALDATSGQFYMLLAVYDYWRCLSAKKPFDGARQNLNLLLDRNSKRYQEMLEKEGHNTSLVSSATGVLQNANSSNPTPSRQPSEEQSRVKDVKKLILKILLLAQRFSKAQLEQTEILRLAQDVITELEMCMFAVEGQSCRVKDPDQRAEGMLILNDLSRPKFIPDSIVFRCLVIFIAIWHQLSSLPSSNYAARVVQAFIMTLFSTVLNQAVSRLQHGLKQALGLDEPAFVLPSPGSSDEDANLQDCTSEKKDETTVTGNERSDRGFAPRRRRRRRNVTEDDMVGSEDEVGDEPDLSEDEFGMETCSDDDYSSDGRNSFLVEESEEEDDDDEENFILDITAPTAQDHRSGLAPGYGDLQSVPEEVNSNGGLSSAGGSQETSENWSADAVLALEELKQRLMLETRNHVSERYLPFISSNSEASQMRIASQPTPAVATSAPATTLTPNEDTVEENSDDAFCREMSMKVANFSIETDNDVPPPEEDDPPGCFIETWPEECAADLLLQQQMEEEASRGELLARRFTVIGNTDLISCITLMDAYIRSADILANGTEVLPDALLGHFATLLNMLNHVDEAVQKGVIKLKPAISKQLASKKDENVNDTPTSSVALQEEHQLRGFVPLNEAHDGLNFSEGSGSVEEEALLRAQRLLKLGHQLANSPNVDFTYNTNQGFFLGPTSLRPVGMSVMMSVLQTGGAVGQQSPQPEEEHSLNGMSDSDAAGQRVFAIYEERKNRLMRDMAQLRLKSEIKKLEATVGADGSCVSILPPYLVPDTDVVCCHLSAIQRLVQVKRFIVVIPKAVVDHLDVLKKQDGRAREVIRYLEVESQRGNRYLKIQQPKEQIGNSSDMLPKKTWSRRRGPALEVSRWRSMLWCSRYLTRQAGPSSNIRGLVAMLYNNCESDGMSSIQSEAVNEGILLEYFPTFYSKWKQSREKG